jgi:hypothetical protein
VPKRPKAECPECGKQVATRIDGTLVRHGGTYNMRRRKPCAGSGQQPCEPEPPEVYPSHG